MSEPSAAALRAAVKAELAIPGRYHIRVAPVIPQKSWPQLAFEWLYDRWTDFMKSLFSHIHVGQGVQSVFGDALILIAFVAIALAVAWSVRALQISRDRAGIGITSLAAQRNAHALWLRATEAAQNGEYGAAIRLLFTATVTLLDLRGIVRDDASATVNELCRELDRRRAPASAPFIELSHGFTKAAYAERPVDRDDWESAQRAYQALAQSVSIT